MPVQYDVEFDGIEYYVRYRHGWLEVYADPCDFSDDELLLSVLIGDGFDCCWNARETNVYLTLLSHSIQSSQFNAADFPAKASVRQHRFYFVGRFPLYPVGLICGLREASPPPEGTMNRHVRKQRRQRGVHDHSNECIAYIYANDVVDWIRNHPLEHEAFKTVYPMMWLDVAHDMELTS